MKLVDRGQGGIEYILGIAAALVIAVTVVSMVGVLPQGPSETIKQNILSIPTIDDVLNKNHSTGPDS